MSQVIELPLDLIKKIASSPYDAASRSFAVRLGFCQALAENGLTPSDLSFVMEKRAEAKLAENGGMNPLGMASDGMGAILKGTALAGVAATLIGSQTGKFHHQIERRMDKLDDPEQPKLREKALALALAKQELEEDLAARNLTPPTAAPKKKRVKRRTDSAAIELLD